MPTAASKVQLPADPSAVTSVVDAFIALFRPFIEVVVHDVRRDRILQIWNPISGRRAGGRSYLEANLLTDQTRDGEVIGPYEQIGSDGRRYVSVSVPLEERTKLLCINFDRSSLDRATELLTHFAQASQPRLPALFARYWQQDINDVVAAYCSDAHSDRHSLTRHQRRDLVALLDRRGLFDVRHAAPHVARTLGISRMTVYTLLKEARQTTTLKQMAKDKDGVQRAAS